MRFHFAGLACLLQFAKGQVEHVESEEIKWLQASNQEQSSSKLLDLTFCAQYGFCTSCVQGSSLISGCAWCPIDFQCYPTYGPGSGSGACANAGKLANLSSCPSVVPQLTSFDEDTARTMAAYSYAVYYDDPENHRMPQGFNITRTFRQTLGQWNDCFGFIGFDSSQKRIVLAFRGSTSLMQVLQELIHHDLIPMPGHAKEIMVNGFFYDIIAAFFPDILKGLGDSRQMCPDCSLWVTGHSLGGALAAIGAYMLTEQASESKPLVYTFGQPRAGNAAFADVAAQRVKDMFRVVNAADAVAHVPFCDSSLHALRSDNRTALQLGGDGPCLKTGYYHFGTEIYYPKGDYLNEVMCGYRECVGKPEWEDSSCSNSLVDLSAPPSFSDHHHYWDVMDNGFCKKPNPSIILV